MSSAIRGVDVEAVAHGERAALLRFARRLFYSREDAQDACQRAFEILMRHEERVERSGPRRGFAPWWSAPLYPRRSEPPPATAAFASGRKRACGTGSKFCWKTLGR